jgi:hypothetical protein
MIPGQFQLTDERRITELEEDGKTYTFNKDYLTAMYNESHEQLKEYFEDKFSVSIFVPYIFCTYMCVCVYTCSYYVYAQMRPFICLHVNVHMRDNLLYHT